MLDFFDVLNKQLALFDDLLRMQSVIGLLNEEREYLCDV